MTTKILHQLARYSNTPFHVLKILIYNQLSDFHELFGMTSFKLLRDEILYNLSTPDLLLEELLNDPERENSYKEEIRRVLRMR